MNSVDSDFNDQRHQNMSDNISEVPELIGDRCQSQCSASAQVYQAEAPDFSKWVKRHSGTLCFIKDCAKRSFFMRIFSLQGKAMLWEQEVHDSFEIKRDTQYEFTFGGQNSMFRLELAFSNEADAFFKVVTETLERRARKKGGTLQNGSATLRHPVTTTSESDFFPLNSF
jgi:hypothetical protein